MDSSVPGEGAEYTLINMDSGLRLAGHVRVAGDSASRRKGLLGVNKLDRESGLWIMPCEAIHTFGLKMPIDVLFLDRNFKVKKLLPGLAPYRISVCLMASSVVEMPAGAIAESKTKVGDRLTVQRAGQDHGNSAEQSISLGSTCPSP
jgi:uncharacterized membrane protein (UPF0127 family)